jgi:hypothetical protein
MVGRNSSRLLFPGDTAVTELLQQASDDQLVLAFCFGALVVSAAVMHFSFYLGRLSRSGDASERGGASRFRLTTSAVPIERGSAAASQDRAA